MIDKNLLPQYLRNNKSIGELKVKEERNGDVYSIAYLMQESANEIDRLRDKLKKLEWVETLVSIVNEQNEERKGMTKFEMYKDFRKELDEYCIPLILDMCETEYIQCENKKIGMLCTCNGYIDCIYIMPQYRRNGYAKKAVLSWYKRNKQRTHITLHIINTNTTALKFWNSIFAIDILERNNVDTLYKIVGLKSEGGAG